MNSRGSTLRETRLWKIRSRGGIRLLQGELQEVFQVGSCHSAQRWGCFLWPQKLEFDMVVTYILILPLSYFRL